MMNSESYLRGALDGERLCAVDCPYLASDRAVWLAACLQSLAGSQVRIYILGVFPSYLFSWFVPVYVSCIIFCYKSPSLISFAKLFYHAVVYLDLLYIDNFVAVIYFLGA